MCFQRKIVDSFVRLLKEGGYVEPVDPSGYKHLISNYSLGSQLQRHTASIFTQHQASV